MAMLVSKSKIKEDNLRMYQVVIRGIKNEAMTIQQMIMERGLHRQTITVIYSILINFTAPLVCKMNALDLLKLAFQTAHQTIINQVVRVLPVLVDIVKQRSDKCQQDATGSRISKQPSASLQEKFVLYCKQMLKQWSEYMVDCNGPNSEYIAAYQKAERSGVYFPQYFTIFTMRDYIEFMLNWMRVNKKQTDFKDKVQIYRFLTNQEIYRDQLARFRVGLHQYAEALVYQAYSILINHSIPIKCKFVVLQSLKDLYQEGNHIYCNRADEAIVPYFRYVVKSTERDPSLLQRFLEKIEKRYQLEQDSSAIYVSTILQLIKQWSAYQEEGYQNPFEELGEIIDRNKMLGKNSSSLFKTNNVQIFRENRNLGAHRKKEYEIPPDAKQVENIQLIQLRAMAKQLKRKHEQDEQTIRRLQLKASSYDKAMSNKIINLKEQSSQTQAGIVQAIPITSSFIETPILQNQRQSNSSKKVSIKEKQSSLIREVEERINRLVVEKTKSQKKDDRQQQINLTPEIQQQPKRSLRKSFAKEINRNSDTMKLSHLLQIQTHRTISRKQN